MLIESEFVNEIDENENEIRVGLKIQITMVILMLTLQIMITQNLNNHNHNNKNKSKRTTTSSERERFLRIERIYSNDDNVNEDRNDVMNVTDAVVVNKVLVSDDPASKEITNEIAHQLRDSKNFALYVSCGVFHFAALTIAGDLFCWGDNTDGQSGIGGINSLVTHQNQNESNYTKPSVASGSSGGNGTSFTNYDGNILNNSEINDDASTPQLVDYLSGIDTTIMKCCADFTFAASDNFLISQPDYFDGGNDNSSITGGSNNYDDRLGIHGANNSCSTGSDNCDHPKDFDNTTAKAASNLIGNKTCIT